MRRAGILIAALVLGGCTPAPEPSEPMTSDASRAAAAPSPSLAPVAPASAEPAEPVEAPTVEGVWQEVETGAMTSDEAIDAAPLPDGLRAFLKDALLEEVLASEEWAEEFPDCPVEARVTAIHPAGFAVGSVLGCGPYGVMGVLGEADGGWVELASAILEPPECAVLAEAGVPAAVPYPWDEGLSCVEGGAWRYW